MSPQFEFKCLSSKMKELSYEDFSMLLDEIKRFSRNGDKERKLALDTLTSLHDLRYDTGNKKRSSILTLLEEKLYGIFSEIPEIGADDNYNSINWQERNLLKKPKSEEQVLVIDALGFPIEGERSLSRFVVDCKKKDWKKFSLYKLQGHRFIGCGLGPNSIGVGIDTYGNPGDYLGSGLDGGEIYAHSAGQDQLCQIMKSGKCVFYDDVGQAFAYGGKGGNCFVMGNTAGRPLICVGGNLKAVINGTCLDYLAESCMAGDPLNGGGCVILNGTGFDERGRIVDLPSPYPGGNLLSLPSGGAAYIRDPRRHVEENQLNGGRFVDLSEKDWQVVLPMLKENERLFDIPLENLLTVDGKLRQPPEVYRKISPIKKL